ncbi:unnamed protein product [Closterium sp. NIES-54]
MGAVGGSEEAEDEFRAAGGSGAARDGYTWTYVSPLFPMHQVDSLQRFVLPEVVLAVGGVAQVEFVGRMQTQQFDDLYYICICHVSIVGCPFPQYDIHGQPGKFVLTELPGRNHSFRRTQQSSPSSPATAHHHPAAAAAAGVTVPHPAVVGWRFPLLGVREQLALLRRGIRQGGEEGMLRGERTDVEEEAEADAEVARWQAATEGERVQRILALLTGRAAVIAAPVANAAAGAGAGGGGGGGGGGVSAGVGAAAAVDEAEDDDGSMFLWMQGGLIREVGAAAGGGYGMGGAAGLHRTHVGSGGGGNGGASGSGGGGAAASADLRLGGAGGRAVTPTPHVPLQVAPTSVQLLLHPHPPSSSAAAAVVGRGLAGRYTVTITGTDTGRDTGTGTNTGTGGERLVARVSGVGFGADAAEEMEEGEVLEDTEDEMEDYEERGEGMAREGVREERKLEEVESRDRGEGMVDDEERRGEDGLRLNRNGEGGVSVRSSGSDEFMDALEDPFDE